MDHSLFFHFSLFISLQLQQLSRGPAKQGRVACFHHHTVKGYLSAVCLFAFLFVCLLRFRTNDISTLGFVKPFMGMIHHKNFFPQIFFSIFFKKYKFNIRFFYFRFVIFFSEKKKYHRFFFRFDFDFLQKSGIFPNKNCWKIFLFTKFLFLKIWLSQAREKRQAALFITLGVLCNLVLQRPGGTTA